VNQEVVIDLATDALALTLKIALPLLMAGLIVGLLVSVFQAVTHIQEMTLSFIPKILAVALVLVVAGPWMLGELIGYAHDLYAGIPEMVGP
jgi:flagellar biosynthesis protein FliQ